jgi:hypothetical protein
MDQRRRRRREMKLRIFSAFLNVPTIFQMRLVSFELIQTVANPVGWRCRMVFPSRMSLSEPDVEAARVGGALT